MKEVKYSYDETVFESVLPNGLKVYLYKTDKTKNFYITVSTHFGSEVLKYKMGDKVYEVTPGSAHFLEHRVLDFTKNKEAANKLSKYGSMANAYTTYNGTNYNIFGQENLIDNLNLLFDRVFKANIKKEDVEMERGIILEEYDMYFDDPYFILHANLYKNVFKESFIKYPVLGTREGIENVSVEELRRLYKDFYTTDNMFVVVTGNFDVDEVMDFISAYTKNLKPALEKPKVIKGVEKDSILCEYEEKSFDVAESKIIVGYKFKMLDNMSKLEQTIIINLVLSNVFGLSGDAFEELNNSGIKRVNWGVEKVDKYFLIYFKASTDNQEKFISICEKYMNNLEMSEEDLERKKRAKLSTMILSFEDLMEIEDLITTEIFTYGKLNNTKDEVVKNITLEQVYEVIKNVSIKNRSILKIISK